MLQNQNNERQSQESFLCKYIPTVLRVIISSAYIRRNNSVQSKKRVLKYNKAADKKSILHKVKSISV